MQHDRVEVPLDDHDLVLSRDALARHLQAIQGAALPEQRGLRRVQVLGHSIINHTSPEADDALLEVEDRQDDPPAEAVVVAGGIAGLFAALFPRDDHARCLAAGEAGCSSTRMPYFSPRFRTTVGNDEPSIFIKNVKTLPPSPQPKQWNIWREGLTMKEGVFSEWKGQRPLKFCPALPSERWALTTSTISARSRIRLMISSGINPRSTLPPDPTELSLEPLKVTERSTSCQKISQLTRRPGHRATAQHVHMQMEDRLAALPAGVGHHPIA